MPTRAATRGGGSKASGKAHTMPAPTAEPGAKKQQMMMPPPVRFGSNNRSSQSVSFNNIIYLAGQHAEDLTQDIKGQTQQVLDAVDKLLTESKSDKNKIIRADIFLKDKSHFKEMNEVWEKWVDPKYAPPCTAAVVKDFIKDKVLVEVVIIAVVAKDTEGDTAEEEEMEQEQMEQEEEQGGKAGEKSEKSAKE